MQRTLSVGLTFCGLFVLASTGFAKDTAELTAADAAKHVGDTVTVTDKVEDVYQAKGGNIFLNLGGKHPNELFTIFIAADHAAKFTDPKSYLDKTITVTGKVEEHKGKAEISVTSPDQITTKDAAASSAASASPSASP